MSAIKYSRARRTTRIKQFINNITDCLSKCFWVHEAKLRMLCGANGIMESFRGGLTSKMLERLLDEDLGLMSKVSSDSPIFCSELDFWDGNY